MRRIERLSLLALLLAAAVYACSEPRSASPVGPSATTSLTDGAAPSDGAGATLSTAVVRFGRPDTGSPFPPEPQHDRSAHAKDNLTPRTVVIDVDGTVTFEVPANVHQLAIYHPGKEVADINVGMMAAAPAPCPPVPLIDDPVMRMTVQTRPCFQPWTYTQTFDTPGRYLVICTFTPHFEVGMYGWVIVRDRRPD